MSEELKKIIQSSQNIVFFGGAGTSTESGIPDFRSAEGLFQTVQGDRFPPEKMLSRSFFLERPDAFYSFYLSRMLYPDAKPGKAHHALAKLENEGKLKTIITQNIDGLHQLAGSQNVLELHGSVRRNACMDCHALYELQEFIHLAKLNQGIPRCSICGGIIKPDVVLYEEALNQEVLESSLLAIEQADVLLVGGTSLTVNPAAGLVRYFRGKHLVLINKSVTPYDRAASLLLRGKIGEVLEDAVG